MIGKALFYIRYYIPRKVRWLLLISITVIVALNLYQVFGTITFHAYNENHNVKQDDISTFERIDAVINFAKYKTKEMRFDRKPDGIKPIARSRATLYKMKRDGKLTFEVNATEGKKRISGYLADIEFTDLNSAARYVAQHTYAKVSVDYYKIDDEIYVVVWFNDGVPVNEMLIKHGWAKAVDNPPTNIVNRLMAEYYYNKAFGNEL